MNQALLPINPIKIRSFRRTLLRWYELHHRHLPWRSDCDPYRVWVSEIMLQQTRVAAVLDHYARFLRRFPTLQSLATAREASVLALWSGLGYYHRARRMHQAAKVIARQRGGSFPPNAEEWSALPGIGRYTAAAIASISFGEAVAVVDGNVERVLRRLFGEAEGREAAWQRAQSLLDRERPGDFNQAMMELGATVCIPRVPQCLLCPVNKFCLTRGVESSRLPGAHKTVVRKTMVHKTAVRKTVVRKTAVRKTSEVYYAAARRSASLLLVQRPPDASLMRDMWELPSLAADAVNGDSPLLRLRHSITDTDYHVSVFSARPDQLPGYATGARWFTAKQCEQLPLTGLTRKILRRLRFESIPATAVSKM